MNKTEILIQVAAAVPTHQTKHAVLPLTCEIHAASLVCFLGQRFSILNCYLQMLAGLTHPQSGVVQHFVETHQIPGRSDFPSIAYLNNNSTLLSVLNGIENVKLPALYHQLGSKAQIEQRVQDLLAELAYDADHKILPSFMSMLQKRHLLIARALMLNPQILFIENPFAGLELAEVDILGKYLASIVKNKKITLITSDASLDFVAHYAEQIIYIGDDELRFFHEWQRFSDYQQQNNIVHH